MNRSIYRQADKRWSSLAYPTRSSSFGGNGCGACSVLHCIIEMDKYKNWTPANVQPYMKQFAVNYQGTTWAGIPTAMKHYGLQNVKNIPTMNQLWNELAKGNRVGILLFGSRRGPDGTVWTGGGHYIAFVDYKVEKGQHWLYLKDSGGRCHDKWWSYEKSMKGDVLQVWTGKLPNGHTDTDPYKDSLKKTGYTGSIPSSTVGRKYGTKAEVKKWQKFLNWWYNFGLEVDGDFGNKTEIATIDFQDAHNLSTDGVAGPKTLAKAKTYLKKKISDTPKSTPAPTQSSTTKFTKEKVIDISYVQSKAIDWKKVKADGVAGVIIRCGYRGYSSAKLYEDSMFMKHVAGAQSVGLKIGIYFFTEAINAAEGKEEAQFALKMLKKAGVKLTYPIAIDTEDIKAENPVPRANSTRLSAAKRTEAIKAFCEEIKANGYEPMIYASTSWLNNQLNMSKLPYTVWVAQYNDNVTYKGSYAIWQYSSLGKVNGINQVVDMNWCYKEYKPKTQAAAPVKATSTVATTVKTTTSTSTSTKLVVDGAGGKSTVSALQKFLGITVDGFISGQSKNDKQYHASLNAVKYGSGGSITVKWLQKWLDISVDGYWGKATSKALQKKLKVTVDGYFGKASMKALQKYLNEHTKATYPEKTIIDKELDACKTQANWMKNYIYKWENNPTVAKSKTKGTCVTYVACVLQRINILKSGEYIWHNSKGKVVGANSKVKITYPSGSLKSLKSKLKKGDIVIAGDKTSVEAGGNSHIFILTGKWSDTGNPYIWDNNSATRIKKGQSGKHTYSGAKKVIAVIRIKKSKSEPQKSKTPSTPSAPKTPKAYSGAFPSIELKKTKAAVIRDAIIWGNWIAGDNSFHYGRGHHAHHNGCYFCGTQPKVKKEAGIKDYQKTYCCNPFIGAAWAHGGSDSKALEMCKKGKSWDFNKGSGYDASSRFKNLGKPARKNLQKGDVLCTNSHVMMYIGGGKIMEAAYEDDNVRNSKKWNASIRICKLTAARYAGVKRVHRYTGSVNTKRAIEFGEVSTRVKQLQAYLNWYFGKKVCGTPDGLFGSNTLKYVKKFQEKQGLKADGIVGPATIAEIKKIKK